MVYLNIIVLLCAMSTGFAINRPVYKIVLKQRGYAQFLQYDIDTPPIAEFTFCTWFRVYDLQGDQSIFTYYIVEGNNRIIRVWLDSGGQFVSVSINGERASSVAIELTKDVWRHICFSYQSDFGAWALYMDSRLLYCEVSRALAGFIIPGGGSVIIGYGTGLNGQQNGLEGEIFGANMIMKSTIERNITMKNDPKYQQKRFLKNRLKVGESLLNYVILGDLQSDEVNNNFETTEAPSKKATKSFIRFHTPHSFIEHEVGSNLNPKANVVDMLDKIPFFRSSAPQTTSPGGNINLSAGTSIWDLKTNSPSEKYRSAAVNKNEYETTDITNLPSLSEYEVPPPSPAVNTVSTPLDIDQPPMFESVYKVVEEVTKRNAPTTNFLKHTDKIPEIETPPPRDTSKKFYGQWTSSNFARSVLNYLKSTRAKQNWRVLVPPTIPLMKFNDNFPYASEFKVVKRRPPNDFQRKNIVEKQHFEKKRMPQINLQILENDLRSNIIKSHAQIIPKNVDITNVGTPKKHEETRFYRNVNYHEKDSEKTANAVIYKEKPETETSKVETKFQSTKLKTRPPLWKSFKSILEDIQNNENNGLKNSDIYTRSLAIGNKWHNVKSYNNDYTPREIKIGFDDTQQKAIDAKIAQINKKNPTLQLRYKANNNKIEKYTTDDDKLILKGRKLAKEISNLTDYGSDAISILKYNHGFLPTKNKNSRQSNTDSSTEKFDSKKSIENNFNRHVKLGNALSERQIIGKNLEETRKSFVGGDERVPDVNKYRSGFETMDSLNLGLGATDQNSCSDLESNERTLFVQSDESIDLKRIQSPLREKNLAIAFVIQNYKMCSLQESIFQNNEMLFIDWSKTPVRLFGGAYPKKTTDLCGFF